MPDDIQILSTAGLDQSLLSKARSKGVMIEVIPFIRTDRVDSVEIQQEIESTFSLTATVVFTSQNAVETVASYMEEQQPVWKIYALAGKTLELVSEYFPLAVVAGSANNASELSDAIIEDDLVEEVIFFCGDQRRDELTTKLQENSINVNEIIVYQTLEMPQKIRKVYAGIMFFSPSGVNSFFSINKMAPGTVLFAVGNTTASAIRKFSTNRVIVPAEPGRENLCFEVLEYFT